MEVNQYNLHAKTYPAITAMIIPFFISYSYVMDMDIELWSTWNSIEKIIGVFIPSALVFSALGYSVRELFRSTSKKCFQNILYCEDETKMPTTEFLLWKTQYISHEEKVRVRNKILSDENYQMMTAEQEAADETEARLNIVGAVKIMRQRTWGHELLTQYNYQYGYWRNLLGGLVWNVIFIVLLLILNYYKTHLDFLILIFALLSIILLGVISVLILKNNAKAYARHLFPIYLTL